jgi:hypothetical protein
MLSNHRTCDFASLQKLLRLSLPVLLLSPSVPFTLKESLCLPSTFLLLSNLVHIRRSGCGKSISFERQDKSIVPWSGGSIGGRGSRIRIINVNIACRLTEKDSATFTFPTNQKRSYGILGPIIRYLRSRSSDLSKTSRGYPVLPAKRNGY